MPKRPNGTGSVSRHRPSGLWRARLHGGDGKIVTRYAKTQKEARRLLDDLLKRKESGISLRADRVSVPDYLQQWLADVAAMRVSPRTLEGYRQHVRDHLAPRLERVTLADLSTGHIQRLVADLGRDGLSPSTIKRIHSTLRSALSDAVRQGTIERNVATLVTLPRSHRPTVQAVSDADARQVLRTVEGHRLEALFVLALYTGLRQGELLGLSWSDLDLTTRTLTVRQTLSSRGGQVTVGQPKTASSKRTIHLGEAAAAALQKHRTAQLFEAKRLGEAWSNDRNLVFVSGLGAPLNGTVVTHTFQKLLAAAGLPPMRFHDLRHAAATLALAAGENLKTVSAKLGHANIGQTADTYGHVAPSTSRDAAERLERHVRGTNAS